MPQKLMFTECSEQLQLIICHLLAEKPFKEFFHKYRDEDGITVSCTFNGAEVNFAEFIKDLEESFDKEVLLKAKELLAKRVKDKLWAIEDNLQKLVDETIPEIKDDVW